MSLLIGGCTSLMGVSPDPDFEVVMPPGVADCRTPSGQSPDARSAMIYGFAKVQGVCVGFFDKATRAQQEALAFNRSLDVGSVATAAVLGVTASPVAAAKAITVTTAGIVMSKALADDYVKIFAFSTYLGKTQEITIAKMEKYQADALTGTAPANYCEAYAAVQKLATMCSLSSLKANLDSQVNIPTQVVGNNQGGGTPGQRVQVRGRVPVFSPRSSGPPSTSMSLVPIR